MYALASPDLLWRPMGSGPLLLQFACQLRHFSVSKEADVRHGVTWRALAFSGLRRSFLALCVAGAALQGLSEV